METEVYLSIFAILISIFTYIISYFRNIKGTIENKQPILIFSYEKSDVWTVTNVGNGPALNILIHHGNQEFWLSPTRIPALSKDASFELSWLKNTNILKLGSTYTDFNGKEYSTVCQEDHSKLFKGTKIEFEPSSIIQHWNAKEI